MQSLEKNQKIAYTMMLSFGGNKQTKNQQLLLLIPQPSQSYGHHKIQSQT